MNLSELQGHWRRDWLRWPGCDGEDDETTRVHWLQAGSLYADIRVPAGRPKTGGARCLADLDPSALRKLMRAEGFAGTITLDGDICTWHRRINWHGRPEGVDAGRMRFEDGALIEDGVHAHYRELWRQIEGPPLSASRIAGGGLEGVLVSSGAEFLVALGRPGEAPSAPMVEALERGERPPKIATHFGSLYALGTWDGAEGVAAIATDPFTEGQPVLGRKRDELIWRRLGFDGDRQEVPLDQDQSAR